MGIMEANKLISLKILFITFPLLTSLSTQIVALNLSNVDDSNPKSQDSHRRIARNSSGQSQNSYYGSGSSGPVNSVPLISGSKNYGEGNCMLWTDIAEILKNVTLKAEEKSALIEPNCCNLKFGLDCVPVSANANICKCMSVYGTRPVYLKHKDDNHNYYYRCFVSAGQEVGSECNYEWSTTFGYFYAYGPPAYSNDHLLANAGSWYKPENAEDIIRYIKWNAIIPRCVPDAECSQPGGPYYYTPRCDCTKGELDRNKGTCNNAVDGIKLHVYFIKLLLCTILCKFW